MIVPILTAIWLGIAARKSGRSAFLWAICGAALAVIIATVITNVGAVMFGPFSHDDVISFMIGALVVSILATIVAGAVITSNFQDNPKAKAQS